MADPSPATFAVIGAGSWGTALAILLARNGLQVRLWGHQPEVMRTLAQERENRAFLPGIPFPDGLSPVADLDAALNGADEVLIVVPSHAFADVLRTIAPRLPSNAGICWATKGLEPVSGRLLHEVAQEILGPDYPIAVISGPSFAKEVAAGLPTAVTVAAFSAAYAERIAGYLHSDCFRAYTSSDVIGLEIGGAAKNVMAIGAGISDGLAFGANARAALITRGLTEIMRLGLALGGRMETFIGLGGMGDLVLTCTDDQSRNRRMGLALAKGATIEQAKQAIGQEVEGVMATQEIYHKACALGVEMPITEQIQRVLYQGLDPKTAVQALLERDPRPEAG
ncbi:NAD(P)H-dependent glycerol-3-phosphate dehydrogenase [Sedimenticola sp.]|uniref:NAD(P)H-dependent glycerol-3-phosphate dehydrogenase n=1 Tax=Sedimenticola sp. TaxID=1940285 RepID=UPI003D0B995C